MAEREPPGAGLASFLAESVPGLLCSGYQFESARGTPLIHACNPYGIAHDATVLALDGAVTAVYRSCALMPHVFMGLRPYTKTILAKH